MAKKNPSVNTLHGKWVKLSDKQRFGQWIKYIFFNRFF